MIWNGWEFVGDGEEQLAGFEHFALGIEIGRGLFYRSRYDSDELALKASP